MDSLSLQKPLLVVVNTELMDNHQTELAEALHQYLISTCTFDLFETFKTSDFSALEQYPTPDLHAFPNLIAEELGIL